VFFESGVVTFLFGVSSRSPARMPVGPADAPADLHSDDERLDRAAALRGDPVPARRAGGQLHRCHVRGDVGLHHDRLDRLHRARNAAEGILLWRSMLQWFGGIGIIVVAMAFLPELRVGGMQIFRSEAFETMGKVLPRAADIAGTHLGHLRRR
jgi:hypothetical protein